MKQFYWLAIYRLHNCTVVIFLEQYRHAWETDVIFGKTSLPQLRNVSVVTRSNLLPSPLFPSFRWRNKWDEVCSNSLKDNTFKYFFNLNNNKVKFKLNNKFGLFKSKIIIKGFKWLKLELDWSVDLSLYLCHMYTDKWGRHGWGETWTGSEHAD